MRRRFPARVTAIPFLLLLAILSGCSRSEDEAIESGSPPTESENAQRLSLFPKALGDGFEGFPWVTDLEVLDLDQDGLLDIVFCEGRLHQVVWLRQTSLGEYEERVLSDEIQGPAHVSAVDMDGDGDLDLLIGGMGIVTPSNEHRGTVVILENDGQERFHPHVLIENVPRVNYVGAGDLDGDGDLDLSVGQFGYFEGEIRWLENLGDWEFRSHQLLGLEGTVHAPIADLNGDGHLDIVALVTQDWEEVYAFFNDGKGNFESRILWGSTNKDYGGSGLTVADLDEDGDVDIVFTNGDGFDYATPGSRPWHGVQWLENDGTGSFTYHRIGDFSGSYSPLVGDIDGDGDLDVIISSGFNDWSDPEALALAYYENDGDENFQLRPIAKAPTHLIVVDAGDLNGDGSLELVSGALHFYPPYERLSRITLWQRATGTENQER